MQKNKPKPKNTQTIINKTEPVRYLSKTEAIEKLQMDLLRINTLLNLTVTGKLIWAIESDGTWSYWTPEGHFVGQSKVRVVA